MRKKLCFFMSAMLVLSIGIPGGVTQAAADSEMEAQPTAAQNDTVAGNEGDGEAASQTTSPDNDEMQAVAEADSPSEEIATEDGQTTASEAEEPSSAEEPQVDTTVADSDEATAPEPSAAPPLRAPGTSGFHATITSNKDSYSAGSTAIFAVKYTVDQGAFQEGDTITVSVPTEVASKVRFSVDPLHFSAAVDKGDGTWELTFGPNASAALAGSFSMFITTAEVTEQTTAPVAVGDGSKDLTVIPKGSAGGVGTYTDAIMKDANDDKVSFGDYDYSEGMGDDAAQIGVYDSTNDETIGYRLFVNNKRATMDSITVVDTLPDGMSFDRTRGVRVTTPAGDELDPSLYSVSISGQDLTFSYPGTLTDTVWVYYWVNARGGTGVKYTNRAEINYQSGGTTYQEHRNYVLQGNDYNAACGEKSVDKTVVSPDPADQRVTYTIKFWNSNGFDVSAINLTDRLDDHVRFVYADAGDKFNVNYDEASHSVLISNTSAISGSETEYVRFVVDFTDVPEGYTVENSVGGNTTKTLKMPTVQLDATKTVDGAAPGSGQTFTFQLCDEQGEVLQEKQNDGEDVTFDRLVYSEDDLAVDGSDSTMHYTVKEKAGDNASYTYDDTIYDVAVTLHRETTPDGRTTVTATPAITKAGVPVASMTFDNKSSTTSAAVTKSWVGPVGGPVTVRLLADGEDTGQTLTLDEDNNWADSFDGLSKHDTDGHEIVYTVSEDPVDGYTSEVSGDVASGFTIINTNTETVSVPVTKEWVGPKGSEVTVRLLADGAEVEGQELTLSEANGWADSFEDLPKYAGDGREVAYAVTEGQVSGVDASAYTTTVTGDAATGFAITNANTETVAVSGAKAWDDDDNRDGARPGSITVNLLADGAEVDEATVTADDGWAYSFDGLPKYDAADGHEISYAVTEDAVPNYATAIDGTGIVNSHTPGRTSVTVAKAWDDAGDQDGMRPDSARVQLYANGEPSGDAVELDEGNNWTHTWTGLFQKAGGQDVTYTVEEVGTPEGYAATVSGDATAGFTVTNTHVPETVSVPVAKEWVGGEGGPVTVRLLADGADTGQALRLSGDGGWEGSFGGLPKRAAGEEIAYTVAEDAVEGYSSEITGDAAGGFTVTNTKGGAPGKPGKAPGGKPGLGSSLAKTGDGAMPPAALLAAALAGAAASLLARRRTLPTAGRGAAAHARHQKR